MTWGPTSPCEAESKASGTVPTISKPSDRYSDDHSEEREDLGPVIGRRLADLHGRKG